MSTLEAFKRLFVAFVGSVGPRARSVRPSDPVCLPTQEVRLLPLSLRSPESEAVAASAF